MRNVLVPLFIFSVVLASADRLRAEVKASIVGTSTRGKYREVDANGDPRLNLKKPVHVIFGGQAKAPGTVTIEVYDGSRRIYKESRKYEITYGTRYKRVKFILDVQKDLGFKTKYTFKAYFDRTRLLTRKVSFAIPK